MQAEIPHQCDVQELLAWMSSANPPYILDVRERWERDICAIPSSAHIPLASLPQKLDDLPQDRDIVAYCHHGVRSLQAAAVIRMNRNAKALSLRGGIHAWAEQVDPSMKKY